MGEQQKIRTERERIRVFLRNGITAEGDAHKKPGAYQARISDMLNRDQNSFLVLTDVRYTGLNGLMTRTNAFMVHIDDVVGIDLEPASAQTRPVGLRPDAAPTT